MNKKIILIIIIFGALIGGTAVLFIMMRNFTEGIAADNKTTTTLPENVLRLIRNGNDRVELTDAIGDGTVDFKKYLFLKYHPFIGEDGKTGYSYRYDSGINKDLKTNEYISASDLDGVILTDIHNENVGHYGNNENTYAAQMAYILNYVKFPENTIIRRDTIWGSEPPSSVRRGQSGAVGNYPKDSDVIETIEKALK